jgi:hypothetical protein
MKKYQVIGTTTVTVYKEVWAANEEDAINKANNELQYLTAYCGNGGYDKLVGVEGENESIEADGWIEWNDTEVLYDDPDYFECFNCGAECERKVDVDGDECWYCGNCNQAYDEDGYEVTTEFDDEE